MNSLVFLGKVAKLFIINSPELLKINSTSLPSNKTALSRSKSPSNPIKKIFSNPSLETIAFTYW
jgi:hypothetical protein